MARSKGRAFLLGTGQGPVIKGGSDEVGHNQLFSLDERLALCASFVRKDTALTDVGTDHAYLPVWLAKQGWIKSGAACDIRIGPLKNAAENIEKYGVGAIVKTYLSDGLCSVPPEMAMDVVMAGMGGELITAIIQKTQWLCDSHRRLILQPMTHAELLRIFLCENGFEIIEEKACISGKKVYAVTVCAYDGKKRECTPLFQYGGRLLEDHSEAARRYKNRIAQQLSNRKRGLAAESDDAKILGEVIIGLQTEG